MNRCEFLAATVGPVLASPAPTIQENLLLLSTSQAESIRLKLAKDERLRKLADTAFRNGPSSVTFHRPEGTELDPHDYFSEGPYWWPDPKNPKGPYIRRDGERNPARFNANHDDLGRMCNAVLTLGMAAFSLGEKRYAEHAVKLLSTWFVDPKTRMNPNLEHGQAIRGITGGRGTGIIDTVALIYCVQGIALLEAPGRENVSIDTTTSAGVRRWITDYLTWMSTSEKGLDEKKSGNNHATWWSAQAAAYAMFTGNAAVQQQVWAWYRNTLVPGQIRPGGSCPREEARTRSLSYSAFNLDAFSVLCRLAQQAGVDLWQFRAPSGASVEKAADYLLPYVLNPEKWTKPQISPFEPDRIVFPGLAGLGLKSDSLLKAYSRLPRANSSWIMLIDEIVRSSS